MGTQNNPGAENPSPRERYARALALVTDAAIIVAVERDAPDLALLAGDLLAFGPHMEPLGAVRIIPPEARERYAVHYRDRMLGLYTPPPTP